MVSYDITDLDTSIIFEGPLVYLTYCCIINSAIVVNFVNIIL